MHSSIRFIQRVLLINYPKVVSNPYIMEIINLMLHTGVDDRRDAHLENKPFLLVGNGTDSFVSVKVWTNKRDQPTKECVQSVHIQISTNSHTD